MHKGKTTWIELLVELHTLDLPRKYVLYTWYSKVDVSAVSPTVFRIMI